LPKTFFFPLIFCGGSLTLLFFAVDDSIGYAILPWQPTAAFADIECLHY
jgi:hypothetical protein